jgi:hypothetical protein
MANQQPTYQAYTVVKREGQDDFWLNIGAAFMHQDGEGFNIILQALPVNAKIVLRPPKGEAETHETRPSKENGNPGTAEQDRRTVRDANDRRKQRGAPK